MVCPLDEAWLMQALVRDAAVVGLTD
jgi:hypothetical protein